jgi:hypothetical protein
LQLTYNYKAAQRARFEIAEAMMGAFDLPTVRAKDRDERTRLQK